MATEAKRGRGRPRKQLDEKLIFELAMIGCTRREIATIVGCNVDTLCDNFSDVLQKGDDEGRRSLRRMQWKAAEEGNVTAQIWLGKNRLGQSDKIESKNETTVTVYDDRAIRSEVDQALEEIATASKG